MQLVSEHVRLAEPGVAAELDQPRAVRALEIFDDTARRMILFREFDCGVGERTAALAGAGKMLRHLDEPGAKLRARVTGMRPREPVPASVGELGKLAQIFRHQFVLRREMAVERHLVGAGGLGNGVDPHRPDSMAIKQLPGGRQDPRARRNPLVFFVSCSGFGRHLWVSS